MRFDVAIYSRLPEKQPLSRLFIDPEQTPARWSHVLPGGFGSCSLSFLAADGWEIGRQLARMSDQLDGRAHLEITAAGHTCYEGRITNIRWSGGRVESVNASGYGIVGLADRTIQSSDATLMDRGTLIRLILATYATGITAAAGHDWQEPGIQHALAEFDQMYPGQAIEQLLKEGDASGLLYDFGIEEGQVAVLRARVPPQRPDYHLELDPDVVTEVDYEWVRNDVAVSYQDIADDTEQVTARVWDDVSMRRYGQRDITIPGGRLTQAGAEVFRNTYLMIHKDPLYAARVTRRWRDDDGLSLDARGLERLGGGEDPPWLVRAGRWARVPSLDPEDPTLLIITAVDYDSESGVLDVQLGNGIPDWVDAFRQVERVTEAVRYQLNPNTGARER